jgi:3-oxoacyl-[acyl-carrier protein] reductase
MDLNLSNKKILITGSSKGIGLALANFMIKQGCEVVINGRERKTLINAKDYLGECDYVVGDVSVEKIAQQVVHDSAQKLGGLDIVICNVGNGSSVDPGEESFAEWQRVFNANFWSTTNIVEAAKYYLTESHGSIVCISSICGNEVIKGAPVTYSCAKAALNSYVKGISRPLGKLGIRINAIAPGNILFDGSSWQKKVDKNPDLVKKLISDNVTMNKFGTVEDVMNIVGYLSSPLASFVTGSVWVVDGGQVRS